MNMGGRSHIHGRSGRGYVLFTAAHHAIEAMLYAGSEVSL